MLLSRLKENLQSIDINILESSDNERFVDLFSAYKAPEAYFTFRDCIRELNSSGNAAGFDAFFSTYDQEMANDIIRTYAPFWRGKQYRKFLSEGMDEGEFAIRLQKAFEQEASLILNIAKPSFAAKMKLSYVL